MKSKKYLITVFSLLIVALVFIASVNIAIDPLFQYHKPLFGMQPVITDERYQNAGIAKNFDFDNAVIGNSMSENFRVSSVSRVFGGDSVKLVAAGSHPLDWTYLLDIICDKHYQTKNLLFNIDEYIFTDSATEMKHDLPIYLYDNNIFNDVNYLFNFSIFKKYTLNMLKCNINNKVPDYDEAFIWNENIGKECVLKDYDRAEKKNDVDRNEFVSLALENINLLIPYIEKMPETNFVFFFSPFSILAYDEMARAGELDAFEEATVLVCEKLMQYNNVNIYYFNDVKMLNTITNLDLYRDSGHYNKDVSEDILCYIENGKCLLTKENYKTEITDFFDFVRNYDFDSIFE